MTKTTVAAKAAKVAKVANDALKTVTIKEREVKREDLEQFVSCLYVWPHLRSYVICHLDQHTIYYKFQIGGNAVAVSWFSLLDHLAYTYLVDDYCLVGRSQYWTESSS